MSSPPPPPRRSKPELVAVSEAREISSVRASATPPRASTPPPPPPRAAEYGAQDFEHSVHLDGHGNILAGSGQLEDLAALSAYACRIGSLVGRQLGFGDVTGMEVTLESGTIMLHRDEHGEIVSVKPKAHLNLIQLRAQLHL